MKLVKTVLVLKIFGIGSGIVLGGFGIIYGYNKLMSYLKKNPLLLSNPFSVANLKKEISSFKNPISTDISMPSMPSLGDRMVKTTSKPKNQIMIYKPMPSFTTPMSIKGLDTAFKSVSKLKKRKKIKIGGVSF